jgi:hypothetical protein
MKEAVESSKRIHEDITTIVREIEEGKSHIQEPLAYPIEIQEEIPTLEA